ncbi:hypothetical protein D3C72_1549390 [compost metagenome]
MNRLNAADGAGLAANQQGFGGRHIALAGDSVQQIAFGDTGGREDDVIAARHFIKTQNFVSFDTHRFTARQFVFTDTTVLFVVAFDIVTCQQTALHIAIQRANHGG